MKFNVVFSALVLSLAMGTSIPYAQSNPAPVDEGRQDSVDQVQPDTSSLKQRVSARWESLIARNVEEAYSYFSPAYRRLFPLEFYLRQTGNSVQWVSTDIQDIAVDGERAEVKILLNYRLTIPPQTGFDAEEIGVINKTISEVWLWNDGNWWLVNEQGGWL